MTNPNETTPNEKPNATRDLFDTWAHNGSAERMQRVHARATQIAFERIDWQPDLHLLDIGCGNGWATRMAADRLVLGRAVGIELSPNMARRAANLSAERANVEFLQTALFDVPFEDGSFHLIHANESIYYIDPIEEAFRKIRALLKPGGTFVCISDFYRENEASHIWREECGVPMTLLAEADYKEQCLQAGFASARTERVLHPPAPDGKDGWEQTVGSLLLTAEA